MGSMMPSASGTVNKSAMSQGNGQKTRKTVGFETVKSTTEINPQRQLHFNDNTYDGTNIYTR